MKRITTAFALIALVASAYATSYSALASDNATVQGGGPRSGANRKKFLNMEGSTNGNFASFGVVDFNQSSFGLGSTLSDITGLTLTLYDAPAGFSASGPIDFFLTTDTTTSIQPGTSPLKFDSTSLPDGVGSQLSTLYSLGTGTYTKNTAGAADVYSLTLNAAAKSYLIGQLNTSGSKIRLVVGPGSASVAATFSGYTNVLPDGVTSAAPTLSFQAVPEPSAIAAFAAGLIGLAGLKRRK